MGCCMSTQQAASSSSSPCQPPPKRRRLADPIEESLDKAKDDTSSRKTPPLSPPPPPAFLYVEEKVKGVLIEKPFSNPNPISLVKPPQNQALDRPKPKPYKTPALSYNADQKWASKTRPLSPQQPPLNLLSTAIMSPARSTTKRERVAGQSPTRKPRFLYPDKANGGLVKMVQSREPGAVVSSKTDPVLGPWKRAGSSPVVARVSNNGVGRSPVAERGSSATGRRNTSPGRVRRDPTRKGKGQAVNGRVNGKELLESPLDKGVIVHICDSCGFRNIYDTDGSDVLAASEPLAVLLQLLVGDWVHDDDLPITAIDIRVTVIDTAKAKKATVKFHSGISPYAILQFPFDNSFLI